MKTLADLLPLPPGLIAVIGDEGANKIHLLRILGAPSAPWLDLALPGRETIGQQVAGNATVTSLDQPFAALDAASIRVIRRLVTDVADHLTRTWFVADHEAHTRITWRRHIPLP
jgi:hypothetical protein